MQSLDGFRDTTSDTSVSDHVSWVVPSDTDSHSHVFVFSVEPKVRDRPGEGGHSWTLFPVGHLSSCLAAVRPPPAPTARLRPSLPLPCPLILQSFLRSSGSVSVTEFTGSVWTVPDDWSMTRPVFFFCPFFRSNPRRQPRSAASRTDTMTGQDMFVFVCLFSYIKWCPMFSAGEGFRQRGTAAASKWNAPGHGWVQSDRFWLSGTNSPRELNLTT